MALLASLPNLTAHEAVADGLYRGLIGLDSHDLELWKSAFAKQDDISFELYQKSVGLDAITKDVYDRIGALDTQHNTSNVRVQVASDQKTAKLTCYCLNQHYKKGEAMVPTTKGFLGGGRYKIDMVKDDSDGLWKMHTWKMELIWCDGDGSLVGM